MKSSSEEIRIRHLYRKMILMGKVKVSFDSARRLVGPDCAFHLYGTVGKGTAARRKNKKSGPANRNRTKKISS